MINKTQLKIDGKLYTTDSIILYPRDVDWGGRTSIDINITMSVQEALSIFKGNMKWSRVDPCTVYKMNDKGEYEYNEDGDKIIIADSNETDMSEFSIIGDIIDHRDGTLLVKMGKPTDFEKMIEMMFGGE